MRRLVIIILILAVSLPAWAERQQTVGDLEIHYNVFNSTFLQPSIAAATQLVRAKEQGVVMVAVRQHDVPVEAKITGFVKNLLGNKTPLVFRQIKEPNAHYAVAQFTQPQREVLTFELTVNNGSDASVPLVFTQEVFPTE